MLRNNIVFLEVEKGIIRFDHLAHDIGASRTAC